MDRCGIDALPAGSGRELGLIKTVRREGGVLVAAVARLLSCDRCGPDCCRRASTLVAEKGMHSDQSKAPFPCWESHLCTSPTVGMRPLLTSLSLTTRPDVDIRS